MNNTNKKTNKQANKYVLIDGPDCSGKSSIIEILQDLLLINVVKEPSHKHRPEILDPFTSEQRRQQLFLLSRDDVNKDIPALLSKGHVISDSGALRGLAYADDIYHEDILNNYLNQPNKHDVIFYLDMTYDTYVYRMINRISKGEPLDIFETLGKDIFNNRKSKFFKNISLLIEKGYDIRVLNVDKTIHDVPTAIYDYLTS